MATEPNSNLFAGEKLEFTDRHPVVYRYFPGDASKPLVAFVPGMSHNARIAYGGHEGYKSADFLSHWFNQLGYGFLGISYPLDAERPIMPATSPDFSIPEWGHQAAVIIDRVITENNLSRSVVVLVWSMGGKILHPVTAEAKNLGIKVELFVSLAATPTLPGLLIRPTQLQLQKTDAGYAINPMLRSAFLQQLDEQNKINWNDGDELPAIRIIDRSPYVKYYLGATPIRLTGSGFRYDVESKDFVKQENEWQVMDDGQAHDYMNLPPMASIYPTSSLDFRHAMTDKSTWSFLMIQRMTAILIHDGISFAYQKGVYMSACNWSLARFRFQELQRVVMNIPELMTAEIPGNHFFFVGEVGAKETAETVVRFLANQVAIEQDIEYEVSNLYKVEKPEED